MRIDTEILFRVRQGVTLGRRSLVLLVAGILGCDRTRNDISGHQDGSTYRTSKDCDDAHAGVSVEEALKKLREDHERFEASARESERVLNLPPFENALEPTSFRRVSRAFLVSKSGNGEVSISERLFGRMPSDAVRYVPGDRPQGLYLVGSLVPLGGYQIDGWDSEERFCLSVSEDGEYLEGEGVSARLAMSDVRQRLDAKAVAGTSGVR